MRQYSKSGRATGSKAALWCDLRFSEHIHYTAITVGQCVWIPHIALFPLLGITFACCNTGSQLIG